MSPIILPLPTDYTSTSPDGAGTPRSMQRQSFGTPVSDTVAQAELIGLARSVQGSKRIVVICGAGVSTAADIPDFRSASGMYGSSPTSDSSSPAKRARTNSRTKEPSIKDLFNVNALKSDALRPAQHALLTDLYERSTSAHPTAFHSYLANLERTGQLLRCYTQNIDGLEGKAGLSVGIPEKAVRGRKKRKVDIGAGTPDVSEETRSDSAASHSTLDSIPQGGPAGANMNDQAHRHVASGPPVTPTKTVPAGRMPTPPPSHTSSVPSPSSQPTLADEPSLPAIPRVIPLHGLLSTLRCSFCAYTCPMSDRTPLFGDLMPCPSCWEWAIVRSALSERQRSSGYLRPDIVLYGEEHPQGHLIGDIVEKDLKGIARSPTPQRQAQAQGRGQNQGDKKEGKADLLIVAGTSLSIPGVKRMVKEFAKSIRGTSGPVVHELDADSPRTPSKSRRGEGKGRGRGQVVFVNHEPPSKSAEWEDVFDYWVKGDIQTFVKEHLEAEYASSLFTSASTGLATPPKTPKRPKAQAPRRATAPISASAVKTPRNTPKTKRIHISDEPASVSSTPSLALSLHGSSTPRSDSSSFVLDTPTRPKSHRSPNGVERRRDVKRDAEPWRLSPFNVDIADYDLSGGRPTKRCTTAQQGLRDAQDVFAIAEQVKSMDGGAQMNVEVERLLMGREESLTPLPDG